MGSRQHTHMYALGDQGTRFSVEAMRIQARRRLENLGYTSTIHMHSHLEACSGHDCEYYRNEQDAQ